MAKHYVSVELINYDAGTTTTSGFPLLFNRMTTSKIARDAKKKFNLTGAAGLGRWVGNEYTFTLRGGKQVLTAVVPLDAPITYTGRF